jgi:hypothetical protein
MLASSSQRVGLSAYYRRFRDVRTQVSDASPVSERGGAVALCAVVSCVLVMAFTGDTLQTNPMSRMATMDALVHEGTFAIDRSPLRNTVDRVKIGEHFYSSKPPVMSVLYAGVYAVLHQTTGLSFRTDRAQAIWVMNVLGGAVPHALLLGYAYLFLAAYAPAHLLLWTFACFAFGQLGLAYATTLNNHVPAALAAFAAFYHAYLVRSRRPASPHDYVFAGLAAGFAPTLDLAAVFISVAVGLYLLAFDWRRTLKLFAPAGVVPVLLHFALTRAITGSWRPISTRPDLYRYPGSYWNTPRGLDALDEPKGTYLYNMLLGHHGLLSMTPVLILAVIAVAITVARRGPRLAEALVVGGSLLASVVFYMLTTENYGGICVGFRWLLPVTPLVLLFVSDWLATLRTRAGWCVFLALLAVSQFHAFSGMTNPWKSSKWNEWLVESETSSRR